MNIKWNYKIELKDEKVFSDIEKERDIIIPKELKDLIKEANAATPQKYRFMLNTSEKDFGSMLSFNVGEKDTDSIFTALSTIDDKDYFPFGIDPFGNYLCCNLKDRGIYFWDHETLRFSKSADSLSDFLSKLY